MIVNSSGKIVAMSGIYMSPEEKQVRSENLRKAEVYNRFINANPWISERQEIELFRARQTSKNLSEFLKVLDVFKKSNKRW